MSFITKREHVFNEYDLFDLPARNEGKLKAYASCTDARAWSHFCSDKTEHLVEIIKRNNDINRTKYVPTNVIVETLMVAKNAEISRLKGKIEEFEQMLTAYDQLDLTCDQKCEIANAHAAIKAANKELDDMCLELDLSGFTEGIDSEAFQTGQSRGDEAAKYRGDELSCDMESTPKMETKSNQTSGACPCDATTNAKDPRIDEMQDVIIVKDAKLNAMQNTIAVMENDVCEPYCIYAHIYTALEKIFGILCQNEKYKQYLDLLTAGKDTRCIDIKGKILFKLKVIEKFSLALIAPCTPDNTSSGQRAATCYRAEFISPLENTFALTLEESQKPCLDNKRAQLVADIMECEEMKEILSKKSDSAIVEIVDDGKISDCFGVDNYSIDTENLMRLKNLQENYDDLMTCFETLKHERDYLKARCLKYDELEKEFEALKSQYKEYSALWNEKEHYRKRSDDLDALKEKYIILADETSNLETQLKAESEINNIKSASIDDLRNENIALEKKINDANIAFEKDKNVLQCKLQETECKVMCQEQQIKSLTMQMNRLLEHDHERVHSNQDLSESAYIEIETLKEQIKNLKEAVFCNEEEKQNLQEGYEEKLKLIDDLRMEIEDWKSTHEKTQHRSDYLEKYTENIRDEVQRLIEENRTLSQDVVEKNTAIENLINVINNKSQKEHELMEEVDLKKIENKDLSEQLHDLQEMYNNSLNLLENEKRCALHSLDLARQESHELLQKIKDYDQVIHKHDDMTKSLELQLEDYRELQQVLSNTIEANKNLQADLASREKEIQRLREINNYAINNINSLQDQKDQYKMSFSLSKKESEIFKESNKQLVLENNRLENELRDKKMEVENTSHSIQLTKKESAELIEELQKSKNIQDDFNKLTESYQQEINKNKTLKQELIDKSKDIDKLLLTINQLELRNRELLHQAQLVTTIEQELSNFKKSYYDLLSDKNELQKDFDDRTEQINNLHNTLESKIEENRELSEQIKSLEFQQLSANDNIITLQNENLNTQTALNTIKKESAMLVDRAKQYEVLESEYEKLKTTHDQIITEKKRLQNELEAQLVDLKKMEHENNELNCQSRNLLTHSECLEKALITARTELMTKSESPQESYADVIKEIDELKKEKLHNQIKIRNLLDKLDESENEILNLGENVLARDDKISIMQNHINELEDEVRNLHQNLAEVLGTGEQIQDFGRQKIDQSLKKMEAHHSRATHNMKIELAQLQNENAKLEEQLSVTKLKSDESFRDKHKYVSLISHLQNEREIIVTDVKQLELDSVGDSALLPNNCSVEEVLISLDRIRKYCDARSSKSSSLEQTLLKMQTSSQLLLSKADEAKKIVEKEKQKIINEKEEAIKDRLKMEKQLIDLKEKLEKQIALDKDIIKDLEADFQNQKLIIDQINKSTHIYISKLEEEMNTLQNMYQNSMKEISKLQEKVENLSEEKNKNLDIIEKTNLDLEEKSKEIAVLQNHLDQLKKKPERHFGVQVLAYDNQRSINCQTDDELFYDEYEAPIDSTLKCMDNVTDINIIRSKKPIAEQQIKEFQSKKMFDSINEVQILTASVEPPLDYIKTSYLNYKLPRLGAGRLEQYSISCLNDTLDINDCQSSTNEKGLNAKITQTPDAMNKKTEKTYGDSRIAHKPNLIDIYNRLSLHTISGHEDTNNDHPAMSHHTDSQSPMKSSAFTEFELTNESFETESNINHFQNSNMFIDSSGKSTDKDLFVIYKESESNNAYKTQTHDDNILEQSNNKSDITVEAVTLYPNIKRKNTRKELKERKQVKKNLIEDELLFYPEEEEDNVSDSARHKLNVQLPRVEAGTPSQTSDCDKKSLDSFTLDMYSSPRQINSDIKINGSRTTDDIQQETGALRLFSNKTHQYLKKYNYKDLDLDLQDHLEKYSANNNKDFKNYKIKDTAKDTSKQPQDSHVSKQKQHQTNHKILNISKPEVESHHKLFRVGADLGLIKTKINNEISEMKIREPSDFALQYILESVQKEVDPNHTGTLNILKKLRKVRSDERFNQLNLQARTDSSPSRLSSSKIPSNECKIESINSHSRSTGRSPNKSYKEQSVLVKMDGSENFENKIHHLTNTLENIENDYKKKIEAIKVQYDSNIKSIINEHNQGVKSIQSLHEETLQDIMKIHENEVENLRSMSIEAMRKADKLQKENQSLKTKITNCNGLDEEPVKMSTPEAKRRKKIRTDTKMLTKTNVEAFNVKPKTRTHGPCTCSLDVNISDTIRNIFEQVDIEQRKMAEHTYLKYIANKILNSNVETLDAQELSFLHLKVCRTWKLKLGKEEALQKKIGSLENELMNKQRHAQQHIAELDRRVAEERRRLQEVREAVCRRSPSGSRTVSPESGSRRPHADPSSTTDDNMIGCNCNPHAGTYDVTERRSAGDLMSAIAIAGVRHKRIRAESNKAALPKLDIDERREPKPYSDEPPTRLRRSYDRQSSRSHKKM